MKMLQVAPLVLCIAFAQSLAFTQTVSTKINSEIETTFKIAMRKYLAKDYDDALRHFNSLASYSVAHHRMTSALLMTGKSMYKLGRYQKALTYFDRLISAFPDSKYIDDAYYGRAATFYRMGHFRDSAKDLLWIADFSEDNKLLRKSVRLSRHILQSELSDSELRQLLANARGEFSSALATVAFATVELRAGRNQSATDILTIHKRKYQSGPLTSQINQLLREASSESASRTKIGVILPLSGVFKEEGLGVMRGIKFAHDSAVRLGKDNDIELVSRDSESSIIKGIHHAKNLINRHRVQAIIGDLESEITAGVGALTAEKDVALVGPAATENGVASVGSTVFQLNSDLERKGRALAEYAISELGLHTFATLAPSDDYGQQMIASFSATVDELGGRIIAQSWYNGTPEDVSRQFKNIREAAFQYDSTNVEKLVQDAENNGEKLRERDIPVLSIDGLFIPISYAEDIKYIAPQFAQNNIRTQLIGGEYLDDAELLKEQQIQPYVNGVIFVSDYFPDDSNQEFRNFRTDFRLKVKRTPGRWEAFGFDAYKLIANAIEAGARSGKEIAMHLQELQNYQGIKGMISFHDNNRVNRDVNFLQFLNGQIIKHVPTLDNEINEN